VTNNVKLAFDMFSGSALTAVTDGKHGFARPFLRIIARLLLHVDDNPAHPIYQYDAVNQVADKRLICKAAEEFLRK